MATPDSLDKVIGIYFARVCREPFTYKDTTYEPKKLVVVPEIMRGYTCPSHCGACCTRFSLDYLPSEKRPKMAMPRDVIVNGNTYTIYSDMQTDHDDHSCRNLIKTNGRCGIYEIRPFSCDFELIRFICFDDDTMLTTKLYGRGWNMLRIDGKRGARCEIVDRTDETCADVTRKLRRLKQWTDYFELKTWLPEIIEWSLNRHQREGPCKLPHDDTGHRFYHCT